MSDRESQWYGEPTTDPPDPPPAPPRADAPQETSGCAAQAVTNGLLMEAVEFMHQNAKLLEKHAQWLDRQGERLGVHERRERERLNAIEKRLAAIESGCQMVLNRHGERLNAIEKELAQGRGDAGGEEEPEPIGQAWIYFGSDGTFWWHTLEPAGDELSRRACHARARKIFAPAAPPAGSTVLVNLVPVYSLGGQKEPTA